MVKPVRDPIFRQVAGQSIDSGMENGAWNIPAHYLRRILSLSTSLGPDSNLEGFVGRFADLACELGGFSYAVVFLFDGVDDAFYAEARHGIDVADWQEILAMPVPLRVFERLVAGGDKSGAPLIVRSNSAMSASVLTAMFPPAPLPAQPSAVGASWEAA